VTGDSGASRAVRARWVMGGVAVGVAGGVPAGLLVGGHLTAGWVGSVAATVAALLAAGNLWGQHLDRAYRRERDVQHRRDAVAKREAAAALARQRVLDEAALVTVEGFGASGFGDGAIIQGDSAHFRVTNGAERPVMAIEVCLEPGVTLKQGPEEAPVVLAAGESRRWMQRAEQFSLPRDQASGNRLRSRTAVVRFRIAGRTWERRDGEDAPRQVDGPPF